MTQTPATIDKVLVSISLPQLPTLAYAFFLMLLVLQFLMHAFHPLCVTRSVVQLAIVSLPTSTAQVPLDRVWPSVGGSQLVLPVLAKPFGLCTHQSLPIPSDSVAE